MTATLNVVVSINSTTAMQTYCSAPSSKLASASPTLCLADGAAPAKGGRTLRHSRPGLHIKLLCWAFLRVFAFLYGLSLTHLVSRRRGGSRKRRTDAAPLASWFANNYSVGRFLRFLLSFTACPSPTFCSIRARAFNGRPNKVIKPCASLWL